MAKKLAISFEATLAAEVSRAAARDTDGNVSAWLAQAARQRLRLIAGRELLAEYEAERGPITEQELAEVRKQWPED